MRNETDSLGSIKIPTTAYYGIGTERSKDAFAITKLPIQRQMIKSLCLIKKTYAALNLENGLLSKDKADAIMLAADEVLNGRLHGQFVTDRIQGNSGFGMNANANEVLANRALELMGHSRGDYDVLSPADVNLNQKNETTMLMAGKLASVRLGKKLLTEAKKLSNALAGKITSLGLDANAQGSLGQDLAAANAIIQRDSERVTNALADLAVLSVDCPLIPLDGWKSFRVKFMKTLNLFSGDTYVLAKNAADAKRNLDSFAWISVAYRNMATNLSKISTDFKLMSAQKRLAFKEVVEGDPYAVIEAINQVSYYIMGNDVSVSRSIEAGELETNVYLPIIYGCIFEETDIVKRSARLLREGLVESLTLPEK